MRFINTTDNLIEKCKLANACKKIANLDVTVEVKRTMENGKTVFTCKITGKPVGSVTRMGADATFTTRDAVNSYLDLARKNDKTKGTKKRSEQVARKTACNNKLADEHAALAEEELAK